MYNLDVTPLEIRDYALSYGWELVREAVKDGFFVLNSPDRDFKQLVFPIEPNGSEFEAMAQIAVDKIAIFLSKSVQNIIQDIREVNDDVISLRYYSESKLINSLSFLESIESIEATKQLILTAGSSVVNPVLYHKRLSRTEAVELLKKTRFRHTEEGSFILKVSCPIQLSSSPSSDLLENEINKPISRRAFELINTATIEIVNAVEQDSFSELLDNQMKNERPLISYNLCDALVDLFDDERELPYELKFSWSRAFFSKLPGIRLAPAVKFPYSFKTKLEELKGYLTPQNKETVDTFFGTVESLNGNIGEEHRRSGEVILALIIESEIVNARVMLNSDFYQTAYNAHGSEGGLIKVRGRLLPGKRIRPLDQIELFELVSK